MASPPQEQDSEAQVLWEQGDYAEGVGGFLYAEKSGSGDDPYDAASDDKKIVGLCVISQTCDIEHGGDFVAVCPLVNCDEAELAELRKGTRPSFAQLKHPPAPQVFVDLSRVMSIDKKLLLSWTPKKGFNSESERTRFGYALERKFGRFAFPEEVVQALSKLRSRILEKHAKDSDAGKAYRSIVEVRIRAAPDWRAKDKLMSLLVLIKDPPRECAFEIIEREIRAECDKIKWPAGYRWDPDMPKCVIANADGITARQLDESKALDLHYLS